MNVLTSDSKRVARRCYSHTHSSWEIIIHLTGHTTSSIGTQSYLIEPGDVMVIPPHVPHDGISDAEYSDMNILVKELDFSDIIVVHDPDGNILTLMNMLHKVHTEKEENYSNIADSLLEAICQYIKKLTNVSIQNPVVYKLKNIIYENLGNADFNLKQEIAVTGSNPDYLRRCFKEELGRTPLGYLTWLRINHAKSLLRHDTYLSIEDVADRCGFRDSFYFSTCFKKHTGTSPLKYRRQFLQEAR